MREVLHHNDEVFTTRGNGCMKDIGQPLFGPGRDFVVEAHLGLEHAQRDRLLAVFRNRRGQFDDDALRGGWWWSCTEI